MLHQVHLAVDVFLEILTLTKVRLESLHAVMKGVLVSIESSSELLSTLPLLLSLDFLNLKLMKTLLDLIFLSVLSLIPQLVLFFASELDFLEVFERGGQLT